MFVLELIELNGEPALHALMQVRCRCKWGDVCAVVTVWSVWLLAVGARQVVIVMRPGF